jgi:serine/threonine-protein kinase RsbW
MDFARVSRDLEINAPATTRALVACLDSIGQFGDVGNLAPDTLARVRIVVEELFLNTINHGYGRECERPVRVRLSAGPAPVLTYEDEAPAFDPAARILGGQRPAAGDDLSREGGVGIDLVYGLSSQVTWEQRDEGNRLVVVFAAPGNPFAREAPAA